jgi:hypothetical protein
VASLTDFYASRGVPADHLVRLTRNFNAYAPAFREGSDALEEAGG